MYVPITNRSTIVTFTASSHFVRSRRPSRPRLTGVRLALQVSLSDADSGNH